MSYHLVLLLSLDLLLLGISIKTTLALWDSKEPSFILFFPTLEWIVVLFLIMSLRDLEIKMATLIVIAHFTIGLKSIGNLLANISISECLVGTK